MGPVAVAYCFSFRLDGTGVTPLCCNAHSDVGQDRGAATSALHRRTLAYAQLGATPYPAYRRDQRKGDTCIWAKWGRFVIFSVLCRLPYGKHRSQILVFTSIWGTKKVCDNDIFRAVFPSIWVSWNRQIL